MFYNTWRSNSNPQSPLNGVEWYNQPIYLFPISSVVDVNTRSGCEVNIQFVTEYIGEKLAGTGTITVPPRNLFVHFLFLFYDYSRCRRCVCGVFGWHFYVSLAQKPCKITKKR